MGCAASLLRQVGRWWVLGPYDESNRSVAEPALVLFEYDRIEHIAWAMDSPVASATGA